MYTVIVFKADKRKKTGEREVLYKDYDTDNKSMLEHTVKNTWRTSAGFRYEIHQTMVERTNMMAASIKNALILLTIAHPHQNLIGACNGTSRRTDS